MSGAVAFPFEKEYEKNPDILREDIQKLREWLITQLHLPGEYISELDLIIIFHCCEKSAEVSKQVLDLHYTLRTLFTSLFNDRLVEQKIISTLNTVLITHLPTPTVRGYKAVYCCLVDADSRLFNFIDVIRSFFMIFDLTQYMEGTWPGYVIMIDMHLVTLAHVAKLDLLTVRQLLYFVQECILMKLKEVHFINAPSFMDKVMMILKPFIKKSLMDIIYIHEPGSEVIYQYVPKKAFPTDVGGELKSKITLKDETIHWIEKNKQYFIDESRKRVKESLRPNGKTTTVAELFGIQGSFKKLDID